MTVNWYCIKSALNNSYLCRNRGEGTFFLGYIPSAMAWYASEHDARMIVGMLYNQGWDANLALTVKEHVF